MQNTQDLEQPTVASRFQRLWATSWSFISDNSLTRRSKKQLLILVHSRFGHALGLDQIHPANVPAAVASVMAVSYTHLTLPTKRIV